MTKLTSAFKNCVISQQCEITDFNIDLNEFCGDIVTPRRQRGETCNDSSECIGENVYCEEALTGQQCYGTYQEDVEDDDGNDEPTILVDRGQDCNLDLTICRPGTVCRVQLDGGTCQDPGQGGDDCFIMYQCASGHYCEGANFQTGEPGTCQPRKAADELCGQSGAGFFKFGFLVECQTFHSQDGVCREPEDARICDVSEQ